jgi:hypothetical protein
MVGIARLALMLSSLLLCIWIASFFPQGDFIVAGFFVVVFAVLVCDPNNIADFDLRFWEWS